MHKKDVQLAIVIIFASILTIFGMSGGNTQAGEIRQVQDALRSLRRVNNLQFSYSVTLATKDETSTLRTDLWVDQLTGSWVEEDYTIDSDGTRPVLRRYCDGKNIYSYIDWNGEWAKKTGVTEVQMPWLERVTTLDYGNDDITEVQSVTEDGEVMISYTFTPEYLAVQSEEMLELLEVEYQNYVAETGNDQVTLEQYQQVRMESPRIAYRIDENGVLAGGNYSVEIVQPELTQSEQGEVVVTGEQTIRSSIVIEIKGYNQDTVLDKIEQYESEIT